MTEADQRFAVRAISRRRLFRGLSIAGIVIASALTVYYSVLWFRNPEFALAPRMVIVLLVLLNARQNLRQYRYARVLQTLMGQGAP